MPRPCTILDPLAAQDCQLLLPYGYHESHRLVISYLQSVTLTSCELFERWCCILVIVAFLHASHTIGAQKICVEMSRNPKSIL